MSAILAKAWKTNVATGIKLHSYNDYKEYDDYDESKDGGGGGCA